MIRRPPRSTRTYTLLPYTTLFRAEFLLAKPLPRRVGGGQVEFGVQLSAPGAVADHAAVRALAGQEAQRVDQQRLAGRSEEHTSELQSLMRISYAVFCLKKKTPYNHPINIPYTTTQNNTQTPLNP